MKREFYRGILEWQNDKIHLSTPSNEAAKFYDASLTQFVGWYDDANLGGLNESIKKMLEADPYFVMGHCLDLGLRLASTGETTRLDADLKAKIVSLRELAKKRVLTEQETKHIDAVEHWSNGEILSAANKWEEILIDCPTDIHALRMAHDAYFYLGLQPQMRDSIARVMPFWQSVSIPLKSYLHGMYAFGLCETNFYDKAEIEGRKGLERNENDGWATHSLVHVHEMQGRIDEGRTFLMKTEKDWNICNHLAVHNYWHLALFNIEQSNYDIAYDLLDKYVLAHRQPSILDLVDATSLMYRLNLTDGQQRDNRQRWSTIYERCRPHFNDHVTAFNDAHYLMPVLGARNYDEANELVEYHRRNDDNYNQMIGGGRRLALPLLEAMIEYERENYDRVVELLMPVRYDLVNIGGSDAQRDVFNQLLVIAAIKSTKEKHRKLAEHLLIERESMRISPLTDRLILMLNTKRVN